MVTQLIGLWRLTLRFCLLVESPTCQKAIREQETESQMQPSSNRLILGGCHCFSRALGRAVTTPVAIQGICSRWFGRPLLRSLGEIGIRIGVSISHLLLRELRSEVPKKVKKFSRNDWLVVY